MSDMSYSNTNNELGERIKHLRKSREMTQRTLAKFVNVEVNHISQIERGTRYPSLLLIYKFSEVLRYPVMEFFKFPKNAFDSKLDNINRLLTEHPDKINEFEKILMALV
nr:MAG TPA: helix-turn-helix domain protein [Caudoviricetes sp.]